MNHVTAALLDLSNIVGGFMLASVLLVDLPRVGAWVRRVAESLARAALVVGVLALVMSGYYLIVHLAGGPHVFHFELVGIGVGVAILRDRLFPQATDARGSAGGSLLLAVFGLIAILVGVQGLLTANG